MEVISSKDNVIIKDIKKLKERKYRDKEKKFLVEGFRFVEETLDSNFTVSYIFINEKSKDKFYQLGINNKIEENTKVYILTDSIFKKISNTENPQGIIAVVQNKEIAIEDKEGFYVLVDKVQDPGNLGTIIRTAHAAGALGVVTMEGTVDVYNDKTLRSTMGSVFHIPILDSRDLTFIKSLKEKGYKFLVSSLESRNNIYDLSLKNEKVVICIGNEGKGISEEIFNLGDENFKIPMPGGAESLNVAVAAAVIMFEIVRQNAN
ncbi:RNA methyltransferase [uncultured Clostridium sp.]|uniref:TrmH family RNA methyltransferase n=1 Tax=uncultured Clostridium sp. TaxID=59620 RepID=UPI0028EB4556|nr:RNA methyltransferase [uncultured Clostridium sp.]